MTEEDEYKEEKRMEHYHDWLSENKKDLVDDFIEEKHEQEFCDYCKMQYAMRDY